MNFITQIPQWILSYKRLLVVVYISVSGIMYYKLKLSSLVRKANAAVQGIALIDLIHLMFAVNPSMILWPAVGPSFLFCSKGFPTYYSFLRFALTIWEQFPLQSLLN